MGALHYTPIVSSRLKNAPQPERPTPIDSPLTIRATVKEFKGRKAVIESTISADGQPCAKGEVVVVQMPEGWV